MRNPLDELLRTIVREEVRAAVAEQLATLAPPSEPPTLLDRKGLARALVCSVATVDRMVREGMPHVLLGDSRRFDLPVVKGWLATRGHQ